MTEHSETEEQEPIDWDAAASRQLLHTTALVYEALGDTGPLDEHEKRFIHQIAYNGGFLELASLLRKVRVAAPTTAPGTASPSTSEAAS